MRILVISNGNSVFVKRYIENVLLQECSEIVLVSDYPIYEEEYKEFYQSKNVNVFCYDNKKVVKKLPGIRSIIPVHTMARKLSKVGKFDVIHVHGINNLRGNLMLRLKSNASRVISTVWGSELMRADLKHINDLRKFFDASDVITVCSSSLEILMNEKYDNKYKNKMLTIRFGNDNLLKISQLQSNSKECRKYFGVCDESVIIMIGYNRSPYQQHIKVLEQIKRLPKRVLEKCFLFIPLTYGPKDSAYRKTIEDICIDNGFHYMIFDNFLSDDEIACMRVATDIFIHAQVTDSLSAVVEENLFCGNIVFNGMWLEYPEYQNNNVEMLRFRDFDELYNKLYDILSNNDLYIKSKQASVNNKEIINQLASWDVVKSSWQKVLYKDFFCEKDWDI